MTGAFDDSALRSRLPGTSVFALSVVSTERLTPAMQRMVLSGADGLVSEPGQDLMLAIPAPDAVYRRRYTIRRQMSDTVTMDVVLHGDGPAATWAANARPGDTIDA